MWDAVAEACKGFATLYSDSAPLRTAIGFAHVGGLVVSGGTALAEDRAILSRRHAPAEPGDRPRPRQAVHTVVVSGLAVVFLSGLLLFAADVETFAASRIFWIKMGLVGALLANGALLLRAERAADRGGTAQSRLQRTAVISIGLWLLTTLAGAALPNV